MPRVSCGPGHLRDFLQRQTRGGYPEFFWHRGGTGRRGEVAGSREGGVERIALGTGRPSENRRRVDVVDVMALVDTSAGSGRSPLDFQFV